MANLFHLINALTMHVIQCGGYVGIFFAMVLESLMIPIPSEVILPFGGYLAASGSLNVFGVVLSGAIGGTAGSVALYYLSATLGNAFIKKWGKYIFISQEHLSMLDNWFKKYGNFALFTTRLLPVVRGIISIPAGIAKMNVWSFTIYTFAGTLIWSFILTYFGFQLGLSNMSTRLVWIVTFATAAIAVLIYFLSHFAKKHAKLFSVTVNVSLWIVLVFFISYSLYESFSPINVSDLNYFNIEKIKKGKNVNGLSFYVVGDTFQNLNMIKRVVNSAQNAPSFLLSLGNMVYSGDKAKYRILLHEISKVKIPFLAIPGPNDLSDQGYQNYYTIFGNYDYAFNEKNVYFIMLNDANGRISPQQFDWLSHELFFASNYAHCIVAMCIPPSWMKVQGKTLNVKDSNRLKDILKTLKVNALILSVGERATFLKDPFSYALVNGEKYLEINVNKNDISVKEKQLRLEKANALMEIISVYLYSIWVLEWPIIGIVSVLLLIIWFFFKQYKVIFKVERKK